MIDSGAHFVFVIYSWIHGFHEAASVRWLTVRLWCQSGTLKWTSRWVCIPVEAAAKLSVSLLTCFQVNDDYSGYDDWKIKPTFLLSRLHFVYESGPNWNWGEKKISWSQTKHSKLKMLNLYEGQRLLEQVMLKNKPKKKTLFNFYTAVCSWWRINMLYLVWNHPCPLFHLRDLVLLVLYPLKKRWLHWFWLMLSLQKFQFKISN